MSPQHQAMLQEAFQAFQIGNLIKAKEILRLFVEIIPNNIDAFHLLALVYASESKHEEAIDCYGNVLKFNPNHSSALSNLGVSLSAIGKVQEALSAFKKSLDMDPTSPESWYNAGNTLCDLGKHEEAFFYYEQSIKLDPNYYQAHNNYGKAFFDLNRYLDAITHFDKALELNISFPDCLINKGEALRKLKRYDEAIAYYDKALDLKPDYAEAWSNKGVILNELKRYDEAIVCYDKALTLKPNIHWIYGNLLFTKMQMCSWLGLSDCLENISKSVMKNAKVSQPFALLAFSDNPFLHKKSSEIYAEDRYPANSTLGNIPKSAKKEKIRIAYFSPDFRNHPVAHLTSELFELHDRDKFEVLAFSLQKSPIGDEISFRLRNGFDRFIDADNISDSKIAGLARELGVDIAIDLAGPTQYSRTGIFSYRAAPIQVNWLGYPGTIGADFIDYIVADRTVIPESHKQMYSEKVIYMPDTYIVDDSKRIASCRIFTREECGLPENAFVFCCFNNDYKFNPEVLDRWSKILLKAKNSVFWISENNEHFRVNIKAEFKKRGIDSIRIIFAPRLPLMADHLARYALADLFLDTNPYNAHTTAVDSLKAGVPVLTLKGQSFASRVAASLLHAIGLPELIADTKEEYETLAIELATNSQKLLTLKQKLFTNRLTYPLFDTPLFTRNLEATYIQIYARYKENLQPDHIY